MWPISLAAWQVGRSVTSHIQISICHSGSDFTSSGSTLGEKSSEMPHLPNDPFSRRMLKHIKVPATFPHPQPPFAPRLLPEIGCHNKYVEVFPDEPESVNN